MAANKTLEKVKKDLFSTDEKVVLKAVEKARKIGDLTLVKPLLILYRDTQMKQVQAEVFDIMNSLKISAAEEELMLSAIHNDFKSIKADILSFIWNSGFYPPEYIFDLSQIVVRGEYMEAIESFTIIENMEGPYQLDQIEEAIAEVNEFMMENEGHEKFTLVEELHQHLQHIQAMEST